MKQHINATAKAYDITTIYDKSGYSPLHFAAYKNYDRICEILIDFVLQRGDHSSHESKRTNKSTGISENKEALKDWINQPSKGEEGFTVLHFAAFHGNIKNIRLFIEHGANC